MSAISTNEELVVVQPPFGAGSEDGTFGSVSDSVFKKVPTAIPDSAALNSGQVIAKLLFATVDPYMLRFVPPVNSVNSGYGVAEVLASKSSKFPVGSLIFDVLPWRRYIVTDIDSSRSAVLVDKEFLQTNGLPASVYITALGLVSRVAYFGIREALQMYSKSSNAPSASTAATVQKGLTLVVSGAAGAVGIYALQFGRLLGATRVIGIAGGPEKCAELVNNFGADAAIDYKEFNTTESMLKRLKELAPNGVDRYFDNTGGFTSEAVMELLNKFGRVAISGQMALYMLNNKDAALQKPFLYKLIPKSVTLQAFCGNDYPQKDSEFEADVKTWLAEKKLKDRQTVLDGMDEIPKAFSGLFAGKYTGKVVVKI